MADLQSELFQALGYTGGMHLVAEYLLKQWQKRVSAAIPAADRPYLGVPTSPTKGSNSGGFTWPGVGGPPEPGQVLYTLYSIDSNPGTEAMLTFGAALLPTLTGSGGGAGASASPSAPALPGGSGGYAAPLLALGMGYLVGKAA